MKNYLRCSGCRFFTKGTLHAACRLKKEPWVANRKACAAYEIPLEPYKEPPKTTKLSDLFK